jgi:hypothetical protein
MIWLEAEKLSRDQQYAFAVVTDTKGRKIEIPDSDLSAEILCKAPVVPIYVSNLQDNLNGTVRVLKSFIPSMDECIYEIPNCNSCSIAEDSEKNKTEVVTVTLYNYENNIHT